jgi:hypothetical protein
MTPLPYSLSPLLNAPDLTEEDPEILNATPGCQPADEGTISVLCFLALVILSVVFLAAILLPEFCCGDYMVTPWGHRVSFSRWPKQLKLVLLPATDSWYHVYFYHSPAHDALLACGINLSFGLRMMNQFYALYLSRANASFLLKSDQADLAPVTDKVIRGKISLKESDYLIIDTAPVFDVNDFPSIRFEPLSAGRYMAESKDLRQAAAVLSKSGPVYAITPAQAVVLLGQGGSRR